MFGDGRLESRPVKGACFLFFVSFYTTLFEVIPVILSSLSKDQAKTCLQEASLKEVFTHQLCVLMTNGRKMRLNWLAAE